jgi:hypothetical protein
MKFARFEVRLDYLLTSHQEGWQINSLCNPGVNASNHFLRHSRVHPYMHYNQ